VKASIKKLIITYNRTRTSHLFAYEHSRTESESLPKVASLSRQDTSYPTLVELNMEEERKQPEEDEECTCGNFKSESVLKHSSSRQSMDSSFVHLPAHLSQPADDLLQKPRISVPYATSPSSLDTYQHLQDLIRAAQSGGDGVWLCADCISR
jgi:hypothetical protein